MIVRPNVIGRIYSATQAYVMPHTRYSCSVGATNARVRRFRRLLQIAPQQRVGTIPTSCSFFEVQHVLYVFEWGASL